MDHELDFAIWHEAVFVRVYSVVASETTIGRGEDNVLHLPDPAVSRAHAVLVKTGCEFRIRDLGSRNGTYLNGSPIRGDELVRDLSEVRIGPYRLRASLRRNRTKNDVEQDEDSTRSNVIPVEAFDEIERREQRLTPAQRRVYGELLKGRSEKEVATTLGIGVNTVHSHSRAIYKTFAVSSRGELLALCTARSPH